MNPLAVSLAAALLASMAHGHPAAHAHGGGASHSSFASHSGGSSQQSAMAHAMAAQQHAYQQAVRQQMLAQQHMIQQFQRAAHEQMKAQIVAQAAAAHAHNHPATSVAPAAARSPLPGTFPLVGSGYLNSPHHAYHSPHHYHSRRYSHHRSYRHSRTWPVAQDPEYAALVHLKQTLDRVQPRGVGLGAGGPGTGHHASIDQALRRVVEVNQVPSLGAIDRLASALDVALTSRTRPTVDTETLAVALRGGVNTSALIAAERAEVIRAVQNALKQAGAPVAPVAAVVAALHEVEREERPRFAHR